jgi:PRC-barrel domain
VEEVGPPIAWIALEEGTPVYDRDGDRAGVVEQVVGDESADIFEGVIVHTHPLPGRHLFADVDQIAELHERGVLLSVDRDALHEPPDESGRNRADRGESAGSALESRLRRAWDWIRGRD